MRAEHEGTVIARAFASAGFAAAVLAYRVAPNRHPAPLSDACRAMRYLRAHAEILNILPDQIAVLGFSAGGHLAASLATIPDDCTDPADDLAGRYSALPNRVALAYAVVSFIANGHMGSAGNLLGEDADHETLRQLSMEERVTSQNPPAFLFHTAGDPVVSVRNSFQFVEACTAKGVPAELHVFPGDRHGIGLATDNPVASRWFPMLVDWLRITYV